MKIHIETPFVKGKVLVSETPTEQGYHSVIVCLRMPVNRVGKFKDYYRALDSAQAFARAVSGGPFPDECDLQWISDLLREHLGICPDEWKEKFPYN